MKKINILTVWDAPNYGSFLQAKALEKYLETKGCEVSFLEYRTKIQELLFLFIKKKQLLFHPIFSIKNAISFISSHKSIKRLNINKIHNNDYDKLVIGSDEVWNLKNDTYFNNPFYYGAGFDSNKVYTYAVSVGDSTTIDFKKNEELVKQIKKIKDNISVRDISSAKVVSELTGIDKVFINCDPTFLIEKEAYVEKYKGKLPDKYIVIYSYRINDQLKENIIKFAKKNNCKIVSLCNYYSFCDMNITCKPTEFSDIISRAEYTIITTFHGSIYSILNSKKFVALTKKQKTINMLKELSLEDRCLDEFCSYEDLENKINENIDYKKVNLNIEKIREKSRAWIDTNILN